MFCSLILSLVVSTPLLNAFIVLITLDSLLFPCDSFLHIFQLSVKILNRAFYVLKLCSIFLLKCLRDVSIICLHMLCFILFQKVICFLFSEWSILLIKHWEVLWGVRKCSALRKFLVVFFFFFGWLAGLLQFWCLWNLHFQSSNTREQLSSPGLLRVSTESFRIIRLPPRI